MGTPSLTYSFQRIEMKYLCTAEQAEEFFERMKPFTNPDEFGRSTINSLYYDSEGYDLIRHSNSKPYFKEKIRSRSYGMASPTSNVFLEIKRKVGGLGSKRRIRLPLDVLNRYINEGIYPEEYDSQILREIEYLRSMYSIKPKILISCERQAFFSKTDPEFRISIDTNLRFNDTAKSLPTEELPMTYYFDKDMRLIEFKGLSAYELWAAKLAADMKLYPTSYSKYGTYYKNICMSKQSAERKIYVVQ